MARYKVILAYDGTEFYGMQRQAKQRTVQSEVELALQQIGWQGDSILAAGRTDTGVHASGQVIAFDFDWQHSETDLLNALNATLASDVAARQVEITRADFHPRYDALARIYQYRLFSQPQRDPLKERYAWRVWPEVSFGKLEQAARLLIGEWDFAAFGVPQKPGSSTVRHVHQAGWQRQAELLIFEVKANAFLYHMVRRMVSMQVEIGQGRSEPEIVSEYLQGKNPEMIQGLAPANGLFLTEVVYA
jgi:tRNA pseudouridine38-40 synthase